MSPQDPQNNPSNTEQTGLSRTIKALKNLVSLFITPTVSEEDLFGIAIEQTKGILSSDVVVFGKVWKNKISSLFFSKDMYLYCKDKMDDITKQVSNHPLLIPVINNANIMLLNNISSSDRPIPQCTMKHILVVPIFEKGTVMGFCGVARRKKPYKQSDIDILLLYAEAIWTVVTRKSYERILEQREGMFRALAEQNLVGIGLIGPNGFEWANKALEDISGYTLEQVQALGGLGFIHCVHPDDRDMVLKRHIARMNGDISIPNTYDIRLIRPNNEVRWVTLSAVRVEIEGVPHIAISVLDSQKVHEAEAEAQEVLKRITATLEALVLTLGRTIEVRDPYTAGHQKRVSQLAKAIATELGLSGDRVDAVYHAGQVHDIGKIGVPAEILAKPGSLNQYEMELIRRHSEIGHDILEPIRFPWPIHLYVYQHHERLDGSGYPVGIMSDQIYLESRIIAVADMVEAMCSHRPYRPALGLDRALEVIESEKGTRLDENVVNACITLFRKKNYEL